VQPAKAYHLIGVRLDGAGPFLREIKTGDQISANQLFRVAAGDFIYSRLFAWRGAFGTIGQLLDGKYVSGEFPTLIANPDRLNVEFLRLWFRLPSTLHTVESLCSGSTPLTRNRFKERYFLDLEIPLPPLAEQQRIVARIDALAARIEEIRSLHSAVTHLSCKSKRPMADLRPVGCRAW
jgi:type I restriction enzyme S subunit